MSENYEKDFAPEAAGVPALGNESLIQLAQQAEARIAALNTVKRVALCATNPKDWVDQGGTPYLQSSGSEKVARLFGVSWQIEEPQIEYEEGGHFTVTYKGLFSIAGATIEAVGTRSSKDGFFKKYNYEDGKKTELPPAAIDRGDVMKSAYTNLLNNGIKRLLGLRNLTYEDLQAFTGITKAQIAGVNYKKDGKAKSTHIASEGSQSVTFCPSDVKQTTGTNEKTGKAWTKFLVKDGGTIYLTFSESFARTAKEAIDAGRQVKITYTTNQYGHNIEALEFDDSGPGESG